MKSSVRKALAAAGFIAASLASSVALAVVESEGTNGNGTFSTAQPLDSAVDTNGTVIVTGAVGNTTCSSSVVEDLDFYSFTATAGDVLTINIDGGIKDGLCPTASLRSVDTTIGMFDASGNLLYANDDAPDIDMGSIATNDSRIDFAVVPADGTYFVGVASSGMVARNFVSGGTLDSAVLDPNVGNGSYTLTISGVHTPPPPAPDPVPVVDPGPVNPPVDNPPPPPPVAGVARINIDIRPRHPGVAKIWANSDGKVAVALLSSSTFNPMRVDRSSLRFGADGTERSLLRCHSEGIDVNRDRKKDLVCLFDLKTAGFEAGDIEGVLTGTVDGQPFEGHAPLKVYVRGKKHKNRQELERHADRR
jgi:pre-peptidase